MEVKVSEFGSFAFHMQEFWWIVDLLPTGLREIVKFCYQELVKVAVLSISRVSVFRLFRNLVQFWASEFEKKISILSCTNQGTI